MKKEYNFSKMKLLKKGPVAPKNTKVQKTVRLDPEVLGWLQDEASKNGFGYQTFLNERLRRDMKESLVSTDMLTKNDLKKEIVSLKRFLEKKLG